MMSLLFLLIAVSAPRAVSSELASAGGSCEPCALVEGGLDEVDGLDAVDPGPYGWLHEDLALARAAADEGDAELAVELASAAHYSLSAQAEHVVEARGLIFLLGMHRALSEVLVAAGEAAPELPKLGE